MTTCFVANWKMNKTRREAIHYLKRLQKRLSEQQPRQQGWEMILAPPYTALASVFEFIKAEALPVALAAQNLHFELDGAHTGEISAAMLRECGCRYVIVGHSERRIHCGEGEWEVAQKVAIARRFSLIPILCVGENRAERQSGKTLDVVRRQVITGFGLDHSQRGKALPNDLYNLSDCLIAYEPVWAIGTGKIPLPEEVGEVHRTLQTLLQSEGVPSEKMPRILYGGSVNEENIGVLMKEPSVDGILAGGASLDADTLFKMMEAGLGAKEALCISS